MEPGRHLNPDTPPADTSRVDNIIGITLAVTAGLTAALAVLLAVTKLLHRQVQRYRGVRIARYTAALGELLSRGVIPSRPRPGWAEDPLFHEALSDYRLMVTGADRRMVDRLIDILGIGDILTERVQRRFPQASRLQALSALVNLAGPRHMDALRRLVDDRNPHVRVNAVRGLARLGYIEAIPHILDVATRVKPWEAARTADALREMGPPAVGPVVKWIEAESTKPQPSVSVVTLAARLLGLIGDSVAEPVLVSLLRSKVPDWRIAAASALEHTAADTATDALLTALGDDDWRVRARAVVALGTIGDPATVEEVAVLLGDEKWWVRQNAADALARIPEGVPRLFVALHSDDRFAADAALNQLATSGSLAGQQAAAAGA